MIKFLINENTIKGNLKYMGTENIYPLKTIQKPLCGEKYHLNDVTNK